MPCGAPRRAIGLDGFYHAVEDQPHSHRGDEKPDDAGCGVDSPARSRRGNSREIPLWTLMTRETSGQGQPFQRTTGSTREASRHLIEPTACVCRSGIFSGPSRNFY
jgi:hypothetical protein